MHTHTYIHTHRTAWPRTWASNWKSTTSHVYLCGQGQSSECSAYKTSFVCLYAYLYICVFSHVCCALLLPRPVKHVLQRHKCHLCMYVCICLYACVHAWCMFVRQIDGDWRVYYSNTKRLCMYAWMSMCSCLVYTWGSWQVYKDFRQKRISGLRCKQNTCMHACLCLVCTKCLMR